MTDGDTRDSGPLTIDEYLDAAAPEGQAEPEEVKAEPEGEEAEEETPDAEQDEPEPDDDAPEAYPVKEYGEIAIELDDGSRTTLKDLVAGNLRQADYSRKTEAVAEERKTLKRQAEELAAKERQLNEQFASLEEPEPNWRQLAEDDPLGWQLQKLEWDKKQGDKAARKRQVEEARAAEREQFRRFTATRAVEAMPEWSDPKKFEEGAEARKAAALAAGFTEQELSQAVDFRLATLLEKAARYDAGQTRIAATQKKLSKVPKVVKPGASVSRSERESAERAANAKRRNKSMSIEDYLSTFDIE